MVCILVVVGGNVVFRWVIKVCSGLGFGSLLIWFNLLLIGGGISVKMLNVGFL